jgi:hypothetical protein
MFICKKNASAQEIIGRLSAAAVEALADLAVRFRFRRSRNEGFPTRPADA